MVFPFSLHVSELTKIIDTKIVCYTIAIWKDQQASSY